MDDGADQCGTIMMSERSSGLASELNSQSDSTNSRESISAINGMSLRQLFADPQRFVFAVEIETSRGLALEEPISRTAKLANDLVGVPEVDLLCLTDNPGGHPSIRPESLGRHLLFLGQEVVVNFSCKDYNRNAIESRLWALGNLGLNNLFTVTGDYPAGGYRGRAQPVFDIDSVGVLELIGRLNEGYPPPDRSATAQTTPKCTAFFPGVAVSPYKKTEAELVLQLLKLRLKIKTGARWGVTQMGYDSRKLDELQRYLRANHIDLPLLCSVFVLSAPAARFFNRWGVPGVYASDALVALAERQARSPDKGRAFFVEFAAKQIAVAKGLGYRGIYLSGRPTLQRIQRIIEVERSFGPGDWRDFAREIQFPQKDEFYLYERDAATGLSSPEEDRAYAASKSSSARRAARRRVALSYRLSRLVHEHGMAHEARMYPVGCAVYQKVIRAPRILGRMTHAVEQAVKVPLYGCQDCGDCSLPDVAYLCPESQCAKNQRNGPCGGSRAGYCEVLDHECVWVRAYRRWKPFGEEECILERPVIFRNGALKGSSAVANTFLGRDHHTENEDRCSDK